MVVNSGGEHSIQHWPAQACAKLVANWSEMGYGRGQEGRIVAFLTCRAGHSGQPTHPHQQKEDVLRLQP